jgi:hypothetical protein
MTAQRKKALSDDEQVVSMSSMDRRDLLRRASALVAAPYVVSGLSRTLGARETTGNVAQQGSADTTRFFPGFKTFDVKTTGAVIHGVVGGQGPPLLLLHGAPQTHVSWRLVAPEQIGRASCRERV